MTFKKKGAAILAATVVVAGLGACSSKEAPSDAAATASQAQVDSKQILTDYFTPFATYDPAQMEAMLAAAEPESPAYVYAEHQINAAQAAEAANNSSPPDKVEISDNEVKLTTSELPPDATDEQIADATQIYKDFEYGPSGKLSGWTTDPGGPLDPRIVKQSGSAKSGGVIVSVKTSYQTNSGDMSVTYTVRNKSDYDVTLYPQGYVTSEGRQVQVSTSSGSLDLAPRTFATEAAVISNGKPGGKLRFEGSSDGPTYTPIKITVPVAAQ